MQRAVEPLQCEVQDKRIPAQLQMNVNVKVSGSVLMCIILWIGI